MAECCAIVLPDLNNITVDSARNGPLPSSNFTVATAPSDTKPGPRLMNTRRKSPDIRNIWPRALQRMDTSVHMGGQSNVRKSPTYPSTGYLRLYRGTPEILTAAMS